MDHRHYPHIYARMSQQLSIKGNSPLMEPLSLCTSATTPSYSAPFIKSSACFPAYLFPASFVSASLPPLFLPLSHCPLLIWIPSFLPVCSSAYLPVCMSVCLHAYLLFCMLVCLSALTSLVIWTLSSSFTCRFRTSRHLVNFAASVLSALPPAFLLTM